jgi:hypothetical protein
MDSTTQEAWAHTTRKVQLEETIESDWNWKLFSGSGLFVA